MQSSSGLEASKLSFAFAGSVGTYPAKGVWLLTVNDDQCTHVESKCSHCPRIVKIEPYEKQMSRAIEYSLGWQAHDSGAMQKPDPLHGWNGFCCSTIGCGGGSRK